MNFLRNVNSFIVQSKYLFCQFIIEYYMNSINAWSIEALLKSAKIVNRRTVLYLITLMTGR